MQPRPKLLYLVHRFPYPTDRGDRIRSFHLLQFLAEHFDVYLATLWDEEPTVGEMKVVEELCEEVALFPAGRISRWTRAAASLFAGRSATEGLFHSSALKKQVGSWIDNIHFDQCLAFCSSMVQYHDHAIDRSRKLPLTVDLVDVDSQKWFDYADQSTGWKRMLFRLEGKRLRKLEKTLPKRCQAITLVSDAEAALFRSLCPNERTYGVSNGVDLEYFCPIPINDAVKVKAASCVFVGALDYRANVQGLEWFCENVWPLVRQRYPEATLDLVGRNPGGAVKQLAKIEGVKLIGQVEDVRPFVHRSALSIAPLLTARGVQNKVLEAMAMGKPVVGTPQAIEGINCQSDIDVLTAQTPPQWCEQIGALVEDGAKRVRMGAAARAFVEENFSWSATLVSMNPLLGISVDRVSRQSAVTSFKDAALLQDQVR